MEAHSNPVRCCEPPSGRGTEEIRGDLVTDRVAIAHDLAVQEAERRITEGGGSAIAAPIREHVLLPLMPGAAVGLDDQLAGTLDDAVDPLDELYGVTDLLLVDDLHARDRRDERPEVALQFGSRRHVLLAPFREHRSHDSQPWPRGCGEAEEGPLQLRERDLVRVQ